MTHSKRRLVTPIAQLRRRAEASAAAAVAADLRARAARKKAEADAHALDLALADRADRDARRTARIGGAIDNIAKRAVIKRILHSGDPNWLDHSSAEFREAYLRDVAEGCGQ